jgi:hypothetical protein
MEKCDSLIKIYDQLSLIVIDEISLVGSKMLSFIDRRLQIIKQNHNDFTGGLDVIMTNNFYQMLLVRYSWIVKSNAHGFDVLGTNFWHEYVKCYELNQVMQPKNEIFINILNKFRTTSQTFEDIKIINNIYVKPPPKDNTLPYLFYTNAKTITHNKKKIEITTSETFLFVAQYMHIDTHPPHFKL